MRKFHFKASEIQKVRVVLWLTSSLIAAFSGCKSDMSAFCQQHVVRIERELAQIKAAVGPSKPSERALAEVSKAPGPGEFKAWKGWSEDLISEIRRIHSQAESAPAYAEVRRDLNELEHYVVEFFGYTDQENAENLRRVLGRMEVPLKRTKAALCQ